ncbi:hypothetical protein [Massilia sp. Leaf139]|uniref:hypothetical protein n=1 Tax=Massilia sp. Leaf139 TaxID=1736272 RepID=UPI000AE3FB38|nr:hypothetical protein [Massilia sp. Leaf139]
MSDESAKYIIELAKDLFATMRVQNPLWQVAYFRYAKFIGSTSASASYRTACEVELLSVFQHTEFFRRAKNLSDNIFLSLDKNTGMFLLVINKNLDYSVEFEYEDPDKWEITKRNGASGIPIGYEGK